MVFSFFCPKEKQAENVMQSDMWTLWETIKSQKEKEISLQWKGTPQRRPNYHSDKIHNIAYYNTHWNIQHTWHILYQPECYKGELQTGCTVRYLAMLITAAPAPQLVTGRCQLFYVSCVHTTLMCSDRCLTANQTVRKHRDNICLQAWGKVSTILEMPPANPHLFFTFIMNTNQHQSQWISKKMPKQMVWGRNIHMHFIIPDINRSTSKTDHSLKEQRTG